MRTVRGNAVFIGMNPKYGGELRVSGTPSGREYMIPHSGGTWVLLSDEADVMSRQKHTACCGVVMPFAYRAPSFEEMNNIPLWVFEPVAEKKVLNRKRARSRRPRQSSRRE